MKRRTAILGLFWLSLISGFSQDTIRIYMDNNFKVVQKDSCSVIRKVVIDDKKIYHLWDSFIDGKKIFDGAYNSINPWTEHGLFRYYNDSGSLYATGNYEQGFLTGQWIYYDDDRVDTVDYTSARKLLKDLFVLEDLPVLFHNEPNSVQNAYLKNNIHFPPRAMEEYSYSKVTVNLHMKKNGRGTPEILRSDHKDFSYEVQRILLAAPESFFVNLPVSKSGDYAIDIRFNKYDYSESEANDSLSAENDTTLPVYVFVEQQAEFQGGNINDFRDWVQKNVVYPEEAVINGEFGRVTLQFVVGSNGQVQRVKLLRTCGSKALDDEALRTVCKSPVWVPARQEGKAVCQQFVIPVIFMLQ
jgi:TonB family protein